MLAEKHFERNFSSGQLKLGDESNTSISRTVWLIPFRFAPMTNLFLVLETEEKTNKKKKIVNKNQNYNNSQRKIIKRCWKLKRPTIQIGRTVLLHYIFILCYWVTRGHPILAFPPVKCNRWALFCLVLLKLFYICFWFCSLFIFRRLTTKFIFHL